MSFETKTAILPLTSIRFLAALYVVAYHTLSEIVRGKDDPSAVNGDFLGLGYISVSFFFVLSGFILARVYLAKKEGYSWRHFWIARLARVYPLFAITLLLDTPHWFWSGVRRIGVHAATMSTLEVLAANLALVQAWVVTLRGIDNPNWSLSVEAFFYLLFPIISLSLTRIRSTAVIWICVGSYFVGMLFIATACASHAGVESIKFSPILHLHEFIEGICAAIITMRLTILQKNTLDRISVPMLLICFSAFAGFVLLSPRLVTFHLFIHDGLLSPLFLAVIISMAFGSSLIHRLLSIRPIVLLGEASYGLYLIHIPLWHVMKMVPGGHSMTAYPGYLVLTLGMSVLGFLYLERPLRRFILKAFQVHPVETLLGSSAMQ